MNVKIFHLVNCHPNHCPLYSTFYSYPFTELIIGWKDKQCRPSMHFPQTLLNHVVHSLWANYIFNQIPLQPSTGPSVNSIWPAGPAWKSSLRESTKRKHFQERRADHTLPTSPHLSSHHNPSSSLTHRKPVSLHSVEPEVTLAHCSRHTDSLTAVEIYWALAKIKTLPSCEILMTSQSFPTWV